MKQERVLMDQHWGDQEFKARKAQVYLVKDKYEVDCYENDKVTLVHKTNYTQAEDAAENWCLGYHP